MKANAVVSLLFLVVSLHLVICQIHGLRTQSSTLGQFLKQKYFFGGGRRSTSKRSDSSNGDRESAGTKTTRLIHDHQRVVVDDNEFDDIDFDHELLLPLENEKVDGDGSSKKSPPSSWKKEDDRIFGLPGQPGNVKLNQYGGYVTVNRKAGRAYYYYFVEAQKEPENKPLLLWLNGGPGCSSIAYGAMSEIGPFRVHSDGKTLFKNNWAWNHAANVLFLESPAGVGFSYSNRTSDYDTNGDSRTALDNYLFLVNWLRRFPEYMNRDFYISGESYAGHYVPQLAHQILHFNQKYHRINLKGIIIGNAVINDETDFAGMYDYFWTHALISDDVRNGIFQHCDFSGNAAVQDQRCDEYGREADVNLEDIDVYNIYGPLCYTANLTSKPDRPSEVIHPCSDYYTTAYLNNPEVQKALHANVTKLDFPWSPCSLIFNNWLDSPTTILPLLRDFITNGLRVWVFSGDTDGRVPVTSTRLSLNKLQLEVKTKWHPWYIKGEVGGYTEEYEGNVTFATVRGAGHQVPSFEPVRALSLIMHFLHGTPLPDTRKHTMMPPLLPPAPRY